MNVRPHQIYLVWWTLCVNLAIATIGSLGKETVGRLEFPRDSVNKADGPTGMIKVKVVLPIHVPRVLPAIFSWLYHCIFVLIYKNG
jgi:hypothetical protein